MKVKHLLFGITLIIIYSNISLSQLANHVVIAEVYGGGGNSGSHWQNDYIILYNPTASSIDVSSWSVQYASASGTTWQVTALSGSIAANGYYAVQEAQGSGGTAPLPFTPNVIGTIAMSATSAKVALVSNQTALSGSDPSGNAHLIDFIGYGSADAYEGTGGAPTLGNTSSARRKDNNGNNTYGSNGSGWDSNDNSSDTYEESDIVTNPPLPVELNSFSAMILDSKIKLNWRTETEVNNYGFEIERSQKSNVKSQTSAEWVMIGFVDGYGNSNSPKEYFFIDENVIGGKYSYRLKQIDNDGTIEYSKVIEVDMDAPIRYELSQNYPNPFNPETTIRFTTSNAGFVNLSLYNILGELKGSLVNEFKEAGVHSVRLNASQLNSGIYFYKLEVNDFVQMRKMNLIK